MTTSDIPNGTVPADRTGTGSPVRNAPASLGLQLRAFVKSVLGGLAACMLLIGICTNRPDGLLGGMVLSGALLLHLAGMRLAETERSPGWQRMAWSPLRGRWLCYFTAAVVGLSGYATLLGLALTRKPVY